MRIARTLPPAATPIRLRDILNGLRGLIRGREEIERFRAELKHYFGVKHCFLVSSGKAAITIILEALHEAHPDRTDVIIPAYTCYSVPSAVVRTGLEIRLCDIDRETLDFDYAQLREILSGPDAGRILAIIPRHIFGVTADIERLRRAVAGSGIAIVEDAAQVMGGASRGKKLGTLGEAGVFSLGRGKALSTVEGGVLITDDDDLAERIKKIVINIPEFGIIEKLTLFLSALFLSVFMNPYLFWFPKSMPFLKVGSTLFDGNFVIKRLSAFQAGLSLNWQKKLCSQMITRANNAKFWESTIQNNPAIANNILKIFPTTIIDAPVRFAVYMRSEFKAKNLFQLSQEKGLGIMTTYQDPVNEIPELKNAFKVRNYPVAKECTKLILTFPTHSYFSKNDRRSIAQLIEEKNLIGI